jgi:hypothetical protein
MEITYLKIASFFVESDKLMNFFIEYKIGEDPFGTFLPKKQNALGNGEFPPCLFNSELCEHYANITNEFKFFGTSNYLSIELGFAISAAMYFEFCKNNQIEFDFEEFKKFYFNPIESNDLLFFQNKKWEHVLNYFEDNQYLNYSIFIENFEFIVNSNDSIKNLFQKPQDLILAELALKNVGRPHFIVIEPYYSELGMYYTTIEGEEKYKSNVKQSKVFLNSIALRNTFHLSKDYNDLISLRRPNLSLCTHFRYLSYAHNGQHNYFISFNVPFAQSTSIGSNFSLHINDSDLISISIKQLMRYSQNFIDFVVSKREKSSLSLAAILEFLTPIFPVNYEVQYRNFDSLEDRAQADFFQYGNGVTNDNLKFRYSYNYQYLKGKNVLSLSNINFYLELLQKTNISFDDIFIEENKITLPYWEIPRVQQIILENYLFEYFEELEMESMMEDSQDEWTLKEYREWINDGLDDFSSADSDWKWNID